VDNQLLYGLILEQVLLENTFQSSSIDMLIFDNVRVNNQDWTVHADPQTVGNGAGGMLGMVRIVKTMLLDKPD
jgi:hypothetical protein